MANYVLSIEDNGVVISQGYGEHYRITPIKSVEDYYDFTEAEAARLGVKVEALSIYCSSTMDFPYDSTNDPAVLALVKELNDL